MRLLPVWKRHADIPFRPHLDLDGFKRRLLWRIDHTHHMARREPRSRRQKIACRSFLPAVRNGLRELGRIAAAFGLSDISAASIFLEPRFRLIGNPVSCFGLCIEIANMDLFPMRERDAYKPSRFGGAQFYRFKPYALALRFGHSSFMRHTDLCRQNEIRLPY